MRALGSSVGATAVAALAVHLLGIGGYQAGEAVVGGLLAVTAVLPFALLSGDLRGRTAYASALAIAAVALSVPLSDAAPFSKGRLRAELDEVEVADFEVVSTDEDGRSWCRPRCPRVTRMWRGPEIGPRAAVTLALVGLRQSGLLEDEQLGLPETEHVRLTREGVQIDVVARVSEDGGLLLTIRLASLR